jgi:hypothetical protein
VSHRVDVLEECGFDGASRGVFSGSPMKFPTVGRFIWKLVHRLDRHGQRVASRSPARGRPQAPVQRRREMKNPPPPSKRTTNTTIRMVDMR